jgi:hypothetical protein
LEQLINPAAIPKYGENHPRYKLPDFLIGRHTPSEEFCAKEKVQTLLPLALKVLAHVFWSSLRLDVSALAHGLKWLSKLPKEYVEAGYEGDYEVLDIRTEPSGEQNGPECVESCLRVLDKFSVLVILYRANCEMGRTKFAGELRRSLHKALFQHHAELNLLGIRRPLTEFLFRYLWPLVDGKQFEYREPPMMMADIMARGQRMPFVLRTKSGSMRIHINRFTALDPEVSCEKRALLFVAFYNAVINAGIDWMIVCGRSQTSWSHSRRLSET